MSMDVDIFDFARLGDAQCEYCGLRMYEPANNSAPLFAVYAHHASGKRIWCFYFHRLCIEPACNISAFEVLAAARLVHMPSVEYRALIRRATDRIVTNARRVNGVER
jgi:hypothetical protein